MITSLVSSHLDSILAKPGALLVDVRGEDEWQEGHIDGALLMPLAVVPYKISEYAKNRQVPIVVYCHSGNRSFRAAQMLEQLGYSEIYDLVGGFTAYEQEKG